MTATHGEAPGTLGTDSADDPRVVRSRAAILAAATDHFLSHGYLAANLEDIAARAGVSKRTIYNVFGDKERLFRATLSEAVDTAERFAVGVAATLGDADDLDAAVTDLALQLARAIHGGRVLALRRVVAVAAGRLDDVGAIAERLAASCEPRA